MNSQVENQIVLDNIPLVREVIKRFKPPADLYDEYVQVGMIGIMKGYRTYKKERAKLSTWLWKNIYWEILRYLRQNRKWESRHLTVNFKDWN